MEYESSNYEHTDHTLKDNASKGEIVTVALVHDWLNTKRGGAEKVLEALARTFPQAPIYTLIHNEQLFPYPAERIHTSSLQRLPAALKQRSRYTLPLIPSAIEAWDFSGYDIVISSSSAFAKNIVTPETTRHICYCHTPARFVWDYWPQYLDEQRVGPLRRSYIRRQVQRFRHWDYVGAGRVDQFLANSRTTQSRIRKFYRRSSDILHPPVDTDIQTPDRQDNHYVTLGMLTPYKKIDLAIEAFNISGKPLKVIGDGPDRRRLEALAADNIEFVGFVEASTRNQLVSRARGLIFPNIEDFGIAPLEAMALGTPVIAYSQGGATETVLDKKTGVFFSEQTPKALNGAIAAAEEIEFKTTDMHEQADHFSRKRFESELRRIIETHGYE